MAVIIGSARIDERGKLSGGAAGDQKQSGIGNDYRGEVSMQNFYVHPKGWYVLRPINPVHGNRMAERMQTACNNPNLGYDQNQRLGVITYGIDTKIPTECDCSSLVRECTKEATGKDPGNFNTANEASALEATGLFEPRKAYTAEMTLYNGDVLVTKTKGHTAIVVQGTQREVPQTPQKPTEPPIYAVGQKYTLTTNLSVRSGAGSEYYAFKQTELPAALQKKDADMDGKLDKGCTVTVRKKKTLKNGNVWIRVLEHDYWILAYNKTKGSINLA